MRSWRALEAPFFQVLSKWSLELQFFTSLLSFLNDSSLEIFPAKIVDSYCKSRFPMWLSKSLEFNSLHKDGSSWGVRKMPKKTVWGFTELLWVSIFKLLQMNRFLKSHNFVFFAWHVLCEIYEKKPRRKYPWPWSDMEIYNMFFKDEKRDRVKIPTHIDWKLVEFTHNFFKNKVHACCSWKI